MYDKNSSSTLEIFNIGKNTKPPGAAQRLHCRSNAAKRSDCWDRTVPGKTTCFFIAVTGLITPDYGDVHIDGQDITSMPMYRRARMGIGYLPQEASSFAH